MRHLLALLALFYTASAFAQSAPTGVASSSVAVGSSPTQAAAGCITTSLAGSAQCVTRSRAKGLGVDTSDFGAFDSGTTHPLSSITTVYLNGSTTPTSTAGWTLSQWQAIYPTATALTNEVDGLAISAALAYIRQATTIQNSGGAVPIRMTCPPGLALSDTSINASGLNGPGIVLDFSGCPIYSTAAGKIAFDMLHSQRIRIMNLGVIPDPTLTPSIDFAAGRVGLNGTNDQGGDNLFDGLYVSGPAPICSVLLNSTESSDLHKAFVLNTYSGAVSNASPGAALCLDGVTHFINSSVNPSIYQTGSGTIDTPGSFDGGRVTNSSIRVNGSGVPVWASMMDGFHFDGYLLQNGTGNYVWDWYEVPGGTSRDIFFDHPTHSEGGSPSKLISEFNITGTNPTPIFKTFAFADEANQSTVSLFHIDTASAVTGVTMLDEHIFVSQFLNSSVAIADQPSAWTMQGDVTLPNLGNWIAGAPEFNRVNLCTLSGFNGFSPAGCWPYAPTEPLNLNPDLDIDQVIWHGTNGAGLANGAPVIDGWSLYTQGSYPASINTRAIAAGSYLGHPYQEVLTVQAAATPTASQMYAIRTPIEGSSMAQLNWGTSNALPITINLDAISSLAGAQCALSIQNANNSDSYVTPFTLPATASTWQQYSFLVPGPTSGTWPAFSGVDYIGAIIAISCSVGSNYQAPSANAWNIGGPFFGLSSTTNLAATQGATLGFILESVFPTPNNMAVKKKAQAAAIEEDQRWLTASCVFGTVCNSNSSGLPQAGAVTMIAPSSFAAGGFAHAVVTFPTTMFTNSGGAALPAITFQSLLTNSALCSDLTQNADGGTPTVVGEGANGFVVECPWVTGEAANDVIAVHYKAVSHF